MIWKNGIFLPESEATLSIYDSALLYGDSVFEMARSFNKKLFKLEAHIDRLMDSIKFTQMPCAYNFHQLKMAHEDLICRNRKEFAEDDEYRTFINVSRGPLSIYEKILEIKPWVMITCYPLRWVLRGMSKYYQQGVTTVIPSQRAIPSRYIENKVKNHCRLSSRLAELEVRRNDPEAWPLLVDDKGYITEGTGANFFICKRDRLITPEPQDCLRGISRNFILSLARSNGIDYRERDIGSFDAITADEAFFTATPWSILPVTKINGTKIGNGKVGKMTEFLSSKWEEEVGCEWREQAKLWDENA
ncbi:MAG TPA: aminotransferase class IV [Candidatus Paceibacterota bacterium]